MRTRGARKKKAMSGVRLRINFMTRKIWRVGGVTQDKKKGDERVMLRLTKGELLS